MKTLSSAHEKYMPHIHRFTFLIYKIKDLELTSGLKTVSNGFQAVSGVGGICLHWALSLPLQLGQLLLESVLIIGFP